MDKRLMDVLTNSSSLKAKKEGDCIIVRNIDGTEQLRIPLAHGKISIQQTTEIIVEDTKNHTKHVIAKDHTVRTDTSWITQYRHSSKKKKRMSPIRFIQSLFHK